MAARFEWMGYYNLIVHYCQRADVFSQGNRI